MLASSHVKYRFEHLVNVAILENFDVLKPRNDAATRSPNFASQDSRWTERRRGWPSQDRVRGGQCPKVTVTGIIDGGV